MIKRFTPEQAINAFRFIHRRSKWAFLDALGDDAIADIAGDLLTDHRENQRRMRESRAIYNRMQNEGQSDDNPINRP